jgi:hypothetical protein
VADNSFLELSEGSMTRNLAISNNSLHLCERYRGNKVLGLPGLGFFRV